MRAVSISDDAKTRLRVPRLLVIDTCARSGTLALGDGDAVLAEAVLADREASRELLPTLERMFEQAGSSMCDVSAVAVVTGPGSFTGVRAGIAAAKALCEATGTSLIAMSRLAVIAETAGLLRGDGGLAALDAGRGETYVRACDGREFLADAAWRPAEHEHVFTQDDKALAERFDIFFTSSVSITGRDLLQCAHRRYVRSEFADVAALDANYMRREDQIYARR